LSDRSICWLNEFICKYRFGAFSGIGPTVETDAVACTVDVKVSERLVVSHGRVDRCVQKERSGRLLESPELYAVVTDGIIEAADEISSEEEEIRLLAGSVGKDLVQDHPIDA
jgi:hypothetical protein